MKSTLHAFILATLEAHAKPYEQHRERANEAARWYVEKIAEDAFMQITSGDYCDPDHVCDCGRCGDSYDSRDTSLDTVNTGGSGRGRDTQEWCEDCTGHNAFYCNRSEEYFKAREFTEVDVEGESVCLEENEDNLYYWESDDEYHWEGEPEEEEETDAVAGYHSSHRPWDHKDFKKSLVFGVELEIKAKNCREDIAELATDSGFLAEEDGSLDDVYGIEIIGSPLPFESYAAEDSAWIKFLKAAAGQAKGWDAGTGYGLHVSINRRAISDFHTGKMLVFVNENKTLCEKVAGRSSDQWAAYKPKKLTSGKSATSEKYEALAIRSRTRLEFRIFRSTMRIEGFLRAVEFTASIVEFTRTASARNLTNCAYLGWLTANATTYRHLAKHLGIIVPVNARPVALAA